MTEHLTPLFRPAAVQVSRQPPRHEDVRLPPDLRWFVFIAVTLVFLGFVLLTQAEYVERISVAGRLTDGTTELYPNRPGTIQSLHVAVGDRVRTGDTLIRIKALRAAGTDEQGQFRLGQLIVEERREIASLIAISYRQEIDAKASNARRRQELAHAYQLLQKQRAVLHNEADRQRSMVEKLKSMVPRGMIAQADIDRALSALHQAEAALLDSDIKLADAEGERVRLLEQSVNSALVFDANIAELRLQLLAIDRRLHEFHSIQQQRITADFDGVVAQILVNANKTVDVDTALVSIRPNGARLTAELYLHSRAMELAQIGTPVRVRYDAYPYRKYGFFDGTIVELSETGAPVGNDSQPVFKARAMIEDSNGQLASRMELRDDMMLMADLQGESRRVIDWLLSPMLEIWRRSAT